MSLDEAIQIALCDTAILRSLNANAVRNPEFVSSELDPQIQASDPNFGMWAATAQYDPRINSGINFAKNDDVFNNPVIGGGATEVRDDVTTFNYGYSDFGRMGTLFSINNSLVHSDSTNPSLLFPGSWTSVIEASVRHPLLQGSGYRFNDLAGIANSPGIRNSAGIVISRISHERIDWQLIGRGSRQGDPGSFQIFLSAEDEILKLGLGRKQAARLSGRHSNLPPSRLRSLYHLFRRAQRNTQRQQLVDRLMLQKSDLERQKAMFAMGHDPYLNTLSG